jgi:ABC-2 type transport system ATP-binding protein
LEQLSAAVGITEILDRPVASYSGGQRRRLEIVRALLSSPAVLFLDEPTVGLDTRVRHDLFDVVSTLREHTGVTILMTTHYLDEAEKLCDRIAVIDQGTLVACDTPQRLLADLGDQVLELRLDQADAAHVLAARGVPGEDVSVVGSTVVISLRHTTARQVLGILDDAGIRPPSATTRIPTLDDVYLRLTGSQISGPVTEGVLQ